jgi:hypothetical protein
VKTLAVVEVIQCCGMFAEEFVVTCQSVCWSRVDGVLRLLDTYILCMRSLLHLYELCFGQITPNHYLQVPFKFRQSAIDISRSR